MRALIAVLAVVWTLLLGTIAVELHQINQHLAWVSVPIRGLAALGSAPDTAETPAMREERLQRRADEINRASDDNAEVLRRVLTGKPSGKSPTARPSR